MGRKKSTKAPRVSTKKPIAQQNAKKAHVNRPTASSPLPGTADEPVERPPTPIRGASSARPGDGKPSYAETVSSGPLTTASAPNKRDRSNSSATADAAGATDASNDLPAAKRARVPAVTASRRIELSEAAELRSRQELGARKTSAKSQLATNESVTLRMADLIKPRALSTTITPPPSSSASSSVQNEALSSDVPSREISPVVTALPAESVRKLEAMKAKRRAQLLTAGANAVGSCSQPDAAIHQSTSAGTTTEAAWALRTLTLSPLPVPAAEPVVPFSTGWEGYDSEEDRIRWANTEHTSSQPPRSPAQNSSPDLPVPPPVSPAALPAPISRNYLAERSHQPTSMSATRLPSAQPPHEALRRSTDPLYVVKPGNRVERVGQGSSTPAARSNVYAMTTAAASRTHPMGKAVPQLPTSKSVA